MIVFCSKYNVPNLPNLSVIIGDCEISPTHCVKNLGSQFDQCLSMVPHISHLCQVAFHTFRTVGCVRKYITKDAASSLLRGLLLSRFDYCNSLLMGVPAKYIRRLQVLQNNAARIIFHAKRRDHVTPLLRELHWLPVERRIPFKYACIVYKCLNGSGPSYLNELLTTRVSTTHDLRANDELLLQIPKSRTVTYGDRSFRVAGPRTWNLLPSAIRKAKSLDSFKKALKHHHFKSYYDS